MAKRVCIIGGTGFIGSRVVEHVHARGDSAVVLGRKARPTRPLPPGVEYRAGNYGDGDFLREVLQGAGEIVCLAHTTVPKTSFEDPLGDVLENLPAAIKLFQIAASVGVDRLVFVSSGGTAYGPKQGLPIDEQATTRPICPYGISKVAIEQYAFMFHATHGLPIICVRPSNAYGPGQTPFIGQGFVGTAIACLLEHKEVVLYGEATRDFVHVRDVAAGITAALDQGRIGECYNLGSGQGMSTRAVLEQIVALARPDGYEVQLRVLPGRPFDVPANVLDASKLRRDTGWQPSVPFEQGIRDTWRWYRDRHRAGETLTG
jgi:UDP-glucose 4-epimerase